MWLRNRALLEMPHVRIMNLEQYDGITSGELYLFITLSFSEDAERQKLQYSFSVFLSDKVQILCGF